MTYSSDPKRAKAESRIERFMFLATVAFVVCSSTAIHYSGRASQAQSPLFVSTLCVSAFAFALVALVLGVILVDIFGLRVLKRPIVVVSFVVTIVPLAYVGISVVLLLRYIFID